MSLILVTSRSGGTKHYHFGVHYWFLLSLIFVAAMIGAFYVGFTQGIASQTTDTIVVDLKKEIDKQNNSINEITDHAEESINALAVRLGELKAHVIRLDALGERLVKKAKLEKGEFNFDQMPALGGPDSIGQPDSKMPMSEFIAELDSLSSQLEHRSVQLAVMESILMNKELQSELRPSGRPVKSGWISSHFGKRTDPFTGRPAHHDGIDIAGKEGSDVIAVASGVVTWAGTRYGYGELVEINHGNGYVTRYGHNKYILVSKGQAVKKGEAISLMGSSGRSTGPHVHFEVIRNGRTVNPIRYVKAK